MTTVCALLLVAFIFVEATVLLAVPKEKQKAREHYNKANFIAVQKLKPNANMFSIFIIILIITAHLYSSSSQKLLRDAPDLTTQHHDGIEWALSVETKNKKFI